MTKIVRLILTTTYRGGGTDRNPHRECMQLWNQKGALVAEYDDYAEPPMAFYPSALLSTAKVD